MSKYIVKTYISTVNANPGYTLISAKSEEKLDEITTETVIAWEITRTEFYNRSDGDLESHLQLRHPEEVTTEITAIGVESNRSDEVYSVIKHPEGHYSSADGCVRHETEAEVFEKWEEYKEISRVLDERRKARTRSSVARAPGS